MTLAEFIRPVKEGTQREQCLASLLFAETIDKSHPHGMTANEVIGVLARARIPGAKRINVASVLAASGHYVDSSGTRPAVWKLTQSGSDYISERLGLRDDPVVNEANELRKIVAKIPDGIARGFVEEAVMCLEVGALRAAIVFLWSGAARVLQEKAFATLSGAQITAAVQRHNPKAAAVRRVEDFENLKDKIALLAYRDLGLIDKGQWASLQEALDLRNRCGHPTAYRPGVKKVESFIEDVTGIVFE